MIKIVVNNFLIGYVSEQASVNFLKTTDALNSWGSREGISFDYLGEKDEVKTFLCSHDIELERLKDLTSHIKNHLGDCVIWVREF